MNGFKYILRSLAFFKRQHFVLFLGTLISSAVLTGALIIGDSVSFSLDKMAEVRLGKIKYAMQTGERFVSDELAKHIQSKSEFSTSGILHLPAIIIDPEDDNIAVSANLYGIDSTFYSFFDTALESIGNEELFISQNIAVKLGLELNGELLIKFREEELVPVQTPFSKDQTDTKSLRLNVTKVLDDNTFSRFSLLSDQKAPYNVFVNKKLLQERAGLQKKSNLLVFSKPDHSGQDHKVLEQVIQQSFQPEDASLKTKTLESGQAVEINSDRIFIEQSTVDSFSQYGAEKLLTYLVNGIDHDQNSTPYSFVTGLPEGVLPYSISKDEIILNDWCAEDLGVQTGDSVHLRYFIIDAFRSLRTDRAGFVVKEILNNQGEIFRKDLMPDFPGLSDAKSCSEWDTGIPIDLEQIREKDEAYWEQFRGTPKAIISYERANELWSNSFGTATALRISSPVFTNLQDNFGELVRPGQLGLKVEDVKSSGLRAASNGVDFGELFLSLSFFVLLSGILLLVLLYSLHLHSRISEIEQLKAIGLKNKSIFKLLFSEILIVIILGNLAGILVGILYNKGILIGLNGIWEDAVRTKSLEIFIDPQSLVIGFLAGTVICLLTAYLVLRQILRKESTVKQLKETPKKWNRFLKILVFIISLVCIYFLINALIVKQTPSASLYMAVGASLIICLLILYWFILSKNTYSGQKTPSVNSLAFDYMSRSKKRSLLTVSLLSIGVFSVLVTGLNRKTFIGTELNNASGTGGYLYWMETAFPLTHDPNSSSGKEIFGFEDESLADSLEFHPLLSLTGDDASCLNLNQVENPGLLGVDTEMLSKLESFSFTELLASMDKEDPWVSLNHEFGDGVIPAYIDQTVLTWGLMKSIGDTLIYKDELGRDLNILISGGLNNTIFQGYVLISRENMQKYFPSVPGANVCLVDAEKNLESKTKDFLEYYFRDYGIEYQTTYQKLDEFNSVTNTYLNVFLILGAIGLLIGTFGFGIVLLRNRIQRRKDRAVLSALGISENAIRKIMVKEHLWLLFIGIAIAVIGASYAAIPSLLSKAFSLPYLFLIVITGIILINGVIWIIVFSRSDRKEKNIYRFLRKE